VFCLCSMQLFSTPACLTICLSPWQLLRDSLACHGQPGALGRSTWLINLGALHSSICAAVAVGLLCCVCWADEPCSPWWLGSLQMFILCYALDACRRMNSCRLLNSSRFCLCIMQLCLTLAWLTRRLSIQYNTIQYNTIQYNTCSGLKPAPALASEQIVRS
jgi:hypothetical protein